MSVTFAVSSPSTYNYVNQHLKQHTRTHEKCSMIIEDSNS